MREPKGGSSLTTSRLELVGIQSEARHDGTSMQFERTAGFGQKTHGNNERKLFARRSAIVAIDSVLHLCRRRGQQERQSPKC